MNKDLIRVEKIKSERKEMLKKVKETLTINQNEYSDSLTKIINFIDYDDKCIKKYEAVVKSQELISNLIMEIINTKNSEDIIKLRNKINYLINKIKKELKSRNISDKELTLYEEKTKYIRKSISTYIRYLKRDSNLTEINYLFSNYDSLSLEDMKRLKKLLKNEVRYNTSQRTKQKNSEKNNVKPKENEGKDSFSELSTLFGGKPKENEENDSFSELRTLFGGKPKENEEKDSFSELSTLFGGKPKENEEKDSFSELSTLFGGKPKENEEKDSFSELSTLFGGKPKDNEEKDSFSELSTLFDGKPKDNKGKDSFSKFDTDSSKVDEIKTLSKRTNSYKIQYGVKDLHEYSFSSIENFFILLRNIPLYISNNSKIKHMIHDANNFYSGNDLLSYIAYTKKRNSIITGLKYLFNKSYLYNGEGQYLNIHDDCIYWLRDYCESRNTSVKSLVLR